MGKLPREALVFEVRDCAFLWGGDLVEAIGWEDDDDVFYVRFRFVDSGYEDGYSPSMLKPLTPAAREFLKAVRDE